jgi:CSLREA domain-containing protein
VCSTVSSAGGVGGAGGPGGGGGGGFYGAIPPAGVPGGALQPGGSSISGGYGDCNGYGGGGAAAGPVIFVNAGTLTVLNSGYSNASVAAGASGGGNAASGSTDGSPIFNYNGSVNCSGETAGITDQMVNGEPSSTTPLVLVPTVTDRSGNYTNSLVAGDAYQLGVVLIDTSTSFYFGYTGPVNLSSTNSQTIFAQNPLTLNCGIAGTNVTMDELGTGYSISASIPYPSITGSYSPLAVVLATVAGFNLSAPAMVSAGAPFKTLTVTAVDAQGHTFSSYSGTVNFTSSDPNAVLPASAKLSGGVGTFTATFNTTGLQTITATDTTTSSLTGTSSSVNVTASTQVATTLTAFAGTPQSADVGLAFATELLVAVKDQLGNPMYGVTVTFAAPSTGASALFSNGSHTITAITNASGIAYATAKANATSGGPYTVTASVAGISQPAAFSLTNQAMPVYVVTTTTDDATGVAGNCNDTSGGATPKSGCSLRDAIAAAAAIPQSTLSPPTMPTINFSVTGTYLVAVNGTLTVAKNMSIAGPGASLLAIDGGSAAGVFMVNGGVTATISGLNISAGGTRADGGGIENNGNLTVNNCFFNLNGTLGTQYGGAIYNATGALTVTNSTFVRNQSSATEGGAIYNANGALTVTNSTFSDNSASGWGGAIYSLGTPTVVTNSTFSGNSASGHDGGAIYIKSHGATVTNSIFAGNTAGKDGAGIFDSVNPVVNADSNVYYQNTGNSGESDCAGCKTNTNAVSGDPKLAPLADYGGPTQTMLPLPGSAAICAGTSANAAAAGLTADQRGDGFDPNCPANRVDAGAVQTNYVLSFTVDPPVSPAWVHTGLAISPAPAVSLTESGVAATAATSTIYMTDNDAALGGTDSANLSGGSAVFNNLVITAPVSGDTLTATLALNPALAPPLNLTASSSAFTDLSAQTISFTPITGTRYALTQQTLSATATSSLPVTFSSTTPSICSVAGSTLSLLTQGTCIVWASQAGNSAYEPISTGQSFAVHYVTQTISFTPITGKHYAGTQLTLSATASSSLPVTFSSTTPLVCSVTGSTLSLLTPGTCIVQALQAGNSVYAKAPTQEQSFGVFIAPQTIRFTPITGTQYAGTQLPLSATPSSTLPVTLSSTTPLVCSVSGSTLSLVIAGTCIVQASQAGSVVYAAAPTVTQSFAVHLAPQTINFKAITGTQYAATQLTLSATASSGLAVTFSSTTTSICTVSGNTLLLQTAGTCIVHAAQAGSSAYAPAATAQSFAVKPAL